MILFFDTETTGLVNFKAPSSDPSQPRLVQIGMIVCEDSGEEVFQFGAMVVPKDHVIPRDMIHGIDHNKATLCGIDLETVLPLFSYWMGRCDLHVCHNFIFDKKVMESELLRVGFAYLDTPHFCTMQSTTAICKLKQATSNRPKWPKLQEAYQHIFGKSFDKAHDALADVRACKEIYFWLQRRKQLTELSPESNEVELNNGDSSPIVVLNPAYEKAECDIRIEPSNTVHVGPPPSGTIVPNQVWNGELPIKNIDLIK